MTRATATRAPRAPSQLIPVRVPDVVGVGDEGDRDGDREREEPRAQ